MKIFFQIISVLFVVFLTACSSAANTNSAPTNKEPVQKSVSSAAAVNDHHDGEVNVAPHDDSQGGANDNHHEGEGNVEDHEHDAVKLPPSRSNIEGSVSDDHHEGELNVETHGH